MFALEGDLLPGVAFGPHRFVVWRWEASPIGPVSALGRIDAAGRLSLLTPAPAYADLLRVWHRVHEVLPGAVHIRESAGPIGRRWPEAMRMSLR